MRERGESRIKTCTAADYKEFKHDLLLCILNSFPSDDNEILWLGEHFANMVKEIRDPVLSKLVIQFISDYEHLYKFLLSIEIEHENKDYFAVRDGYAAMGKSWANAMTYCNERIKAAEGKKCGQNE